MLEELQRRNYLPNNIRVYSSTVADFAKHFRKSPAAVEGRYLCFLSDTTSAALHFSGRCVEMPFPESSL